jgi:hypothetical protein
MMFRKTICGLAVLCLVVLGMQSTAQAGTGAFAGMALPTGTFGDMAGTGYYVGGEYYMPVAPTTSVGVRGTYNHFGWDQDVDGSFKAIEAMAYGKISSPAGPFGMVGMGLSNYKASIGDLDGSRESDFAWTVGGGYDLTKVQISALYHTIATEGESTNWITFSAGIGF